MAHARVVRPEPALRRSTLALALSLGLVVAACSSGPPAALADLCTKAVAFHGSLNASTATQAQVDGLASALSAAKAAGASGGDLQTATRFVDAATRMWTLGQTLQNDTLNATGDPTLAQQQLLQATATYSTADGAMSQLCGS